MSDPARAERADALYERLTLGVFKDMAERFNVERELVTALPHGCERAVRGYTRVTTTTATTSPTASRISPSTRKRA